MGICTKKPPESGSSLATGTGSGGLGNALKHGERITRMGEGKKRSREMAKFINDFVNELVDYNDARDFEGDPRVQEYRKLGNDIRLCSNYLVFNNYYTIDEIRLAKITSCKKHMLCRVCARIRAAKMVSKYLERLEIMRESNPAIKLAFLTLTVKDGEDLLERQDHLEKSWKKYQEKRRDFLKKGRGFNELCKTDGAVFSYEVKKGKNSNLWHPHLHAVVSLNDYVDVKKMSDEWRKITGDSFVVDIRMLKGDISEAFLEVFKYALKFSDMDLDQNFYAYRKLKGRRLQGSYGEFWGVKVPDKTTDDLFEDLPFFEMFYQYSSDKKSFDLTDFKKKYSSPNMDSFSSDLDSLS